MIFLSLFGQLKKNNNYILLDSCGIEVFRRKENRKKEIYQYCEDNGIDYQEEFKINPKIILGIYLLGWYVPSLKNKSNKYFFLLSLYI